METVADFIFLGSKITADGDCSHELKRCLLLEGIAMTNLKSVLKTRDITLMEESKEELKSLLMKVKEENEKAGLKLSIQKMKIMVSGPITSWKKMEKQWKQCQTLFSRQVVIASMKLKDAYSLEGKL